METIGLLAAMSLESKALLRKIRGVSRFPAGSFHVARFQLPNRECLLITSGMGMERARDATRSLLGIKTPQLLISFGIAGAVENDLEIGEVIVARDSCLMTQGLPGKFHPLAHLTDDAFRAAAQALMVEGMHLTPGTILTTRGLQVILKEQGEILHPVLDMETAGIVQVAAEAGIPLLSLRSISDGPSSPLPFDLATVMDDKYHFPIGRMIKKVLQQPRIISQGRQVIKNSKKAAELAAIALMAVLRQPGPITRTCGVNPAPFS